MKRNFLYNIFLAASLVGITACSNDDANGNYTVGSTDNEISIATGVVSGITRGATTRAFYNTAAYEFLPLTEGTKVHIKTEGLWRENAITHYTQTGTVGTADGTQSPISGVGIYWDDYGTADPANTTNRAEGINVYAACIDGKDASAIGTISNWESLSWTISSDMSTWKDKDLLFSNNNSDEGKTNSTGMNKENTGRYKFDTQKGGTTCNLELHHAMSKITVNLKARNGFPVTDGVANFAQDPIVKLTSAKLSGNVNIKALTATPTGDATSDIALAKAATATTGYTSTFEGLIFPGNVLTAATQKIATINCDGNIYNVYAKELMDAMKVAENNTEDYNFHSGKNYVINIIVDKTEIKVTATVVKWIDVEASPIEPKIEVTTSLGEKGETGEGFTSFNFYMRDDKEASYAMYGGTANGTKADGTTPWSFTTPIYWPSHDTHYHMRGVYPTTATVTDNKIAVANGAYDASTFPSNLMIGAPELAANTMCDNDTHDNVDMSEHGICAREATINLNFRHAMSQVEIILSTTSGNDAVRLENAQVEILNGYTEGNVDIDSRTVTPSTTGNYTLNTTSADANHRHSIIIPQDLTDDLQFKITITNANDTKDYYYATINTIPVSENGSASALISAWEAGKHYVYTLNMRKTEIKVTATIKDWITATGSTEIWF